MVREVVMRAIKDKKRMLAASFAIMRTQWFLSDLYDIYKEGKLPSDFKIYFDSPTANDVNKVMLKNPDCLDDRAREELLNKNENFLNFPNLVYVPNKQKSMALDSLREPHLLISASGMWFMGRVKSHLKSHISDSQTTLISMGYQCPGCIGSLLEQGKEKNPVIKIDGEDHRYLAEHVRLRGYSAHADGNQCVRHVCEKIKPLVGAFAVHGEQPNIDWTVNEIRKKGRNAQGVVKNKFYRL
jgi:metallo-beta-lactamase family protein